MPAMMFRRGRKDQKEREDRKSGRKGRKRRKEAALGNMDVNAEELCKAKDEILRDIACCRDRDLLDDFMDGAWACRAGKRRDTDPRDRDIISFLAGYDAERNLTECYKDGAAAQIVGRSREESCHKWKNPKIPKFPGEIKIFKRGYDDQARRGRTCEGLADDPRDMQERDSSGRGSSGQCMQSAGLLHTWSPCLQGGRFAGA